MAQEFLRNNAHVSTNSFRVKYTYKFLFSSLLALQPCVDVDALHGLVTVDFPWWGCKPHAQPLIWRIRHYTSSDPYPLTCLALVSLPGTYPPVSIALRVTGERRPPLHYQAVVLEEDKCMYPIINPNSQVPSYITFINYHGFPMIRGNSFPIHP
jgi:hypothetical protein